MNIEDATWHVIDALHAEGIPFLLVGSFSSNYYGISRSTEDADLVIDLAGRPAGSIKQHLASDFQLDPQISFETITGTTRDIVRVAGTDFKVELFRLSADPHDQERFRRRRRVQLFGREIWFPTAEDVIITKLRWCRAKDRLDVADVIAVQGDALNWDDIYHWCDIHGTREVLDEIRRDIPPID
ncbi:MAG: hypothetical protein HZA46_13720 [Planctomycetales bacterium]|nr:hypothetical protein [Planctomycetales bacterium]